MDHSRPTLPQQDDSAHRLTDDELVQVGAAFAQRGDAVRAQQYWVRALEASAEPDEVLPQLIATYVRDHQYRLAIQCAEEQLRSHPSDADLRMLTGALHEAIGSVQAAAGHYARVVEARPEQAEAHYALAFALIAGGRDRLRADEHLRHYLALEPEGVHSEQVQAALLTEVHP